MSATTCLTDLLEHSARQYPDKIAVCVPGGGSVTYRELSVLSDRLRDRLWLAGVRPADRVAFRLRKSLDSVVSLFGIMKAGAAYVPVDAESPAPRGAYIMNDCAVKAVITERDLAPGLTAELTALGASPHVFALDPAEPGLPIRSLLDALDAAGVAPPVPSPPVQPDDIAYILYTSGSTGQPKGVVLSHRNAASFIDWISDVFAPESTDTFSSHAPFHFDLSILDIFVPIKHGARLVLIGEALGKDPGALAPAIATEGITIWYSTPSILSLLADYGKLDQYDYSKLRIVYFAGEVFPIPRFRTLRAFWPQPRFVNLYGPTETNVCTFYEVPADGSWEQMATFPIGAMCVPNEGRVVDEDGKAVAYGAEGELIVAGPNVMQGYWNLPEQNARAFFTDAAGRKWYRTGDIVAEEASGQFRYLGRRDRMVKRRGYRVELGEIEVGLLKHPDVREAAVVAVAHPESGVQIVAAVSCSAGKRLSIIELKIHSAKNLPPYMIPDRFSVLEALPRTSTDKVDYQALKASA
ncbi:amino acid adenylation domain-containing protein [Luteitalea sp.]|uniref:amino acid adenylation domain-containing protein n=1 Tax=Luteitalea sp. TaxID=2004800 RepID=UPI0025BE80B4|nr:amino acid adenylation domain-containing protein [Luteitalea sp.]